MSCKPPSVHAQRGRTGPETRARPQPLGCFRPLLWTRAQGPRLTCDGAVVIVPRDPGQPHTPLRQVGELQVPGSVWPSWQQKEKTPRRTLELGPGRPCASPSPGHCPMDRSSMDGGHHSRDRPQPALDGHPFPQGFTEGRGGDRPQFHLSPPRKSIKGCRAQRKFRLMHPISKGHLRKHFSLDICSQPLGKLVRKCEVLLHFLMIIFHTVHQSSEGQEPRRVFGMVSRVDTFREQEGQGAPGQGGAPAGFLTAVRAAHFWSSRLTGFP